MPSRNPILQPIKVMIAEDDPADAALVVRGLRRAGFEPDWVTVETEVDFNRVLRSGIELVLSDYSMPEMSALRALELLAASGLDIPLIIISGTIGEETAVEAMKLGAADYLLKDRLGRLGQAVRTVLERRQAKLERAAAQATLHESERRFREMLENVEMIALMLDTQGTVTFCNDFLLRLTGWSREEVVGGDWFSRFIPTTDAAIRQLFKDAIVAGTIPPHNENPVATKTGELREILWSNTILRDSDQCLVGVACLGEDVSERRRAERALRTSEERFRQIAENIREVFWMADADIEQVLYVSPAYAAVWGRTCESLYRSPGTWMDSVVPEDRAGLLRAIESRHLTGGFDESYRIARPDGSIRWIRDRAFCVKDDLGKIYRFVGTAEDITDRKRLEEQFLRAQRLESVGMLAAGIAHDLNNVLAPVLMATPMLREHLNDNEDLQMLATVERSAKRGAALVKQILGFAHGISGEPIPVQPKHLLNDVCSIIQETFPKSIHLEAIVPKDLWVIRGNPTQIHQVLLNLCVNARDAMPEGGTLRLKGENVILDEAGALGIEGGRPGRWLVLHVEDTGTGIEPGILAHIWEPFFTTKAADKGTGLGLSTVRGIVETHRGFVSLTSVPGQGTRVRVHLPVSDGTPGDEAPPTSAPRGNGELILVVDDEANIRNMVRTIVSRHGYRVLAAVDGIEAISTLARQVGEIDLVVTDMMMPRLGGQSLIDVIRRLNPGAKILAMSGGTQGGEDPAGPGRRADSFLMKPFSADALLSEIYDLLKSRKPDRKAP